MRRIPTLFLWILLITSSFMVNAADALVEMPLEAVMEHMIAVGEAMPFGPFIEHMKAADEKISDDENVQIDADDARNTMEKVIPQCSICIGDLINSDSECKTPCGHNFHNHCLDPWKYAEKKDTCPLCRHDLFPLITLIRNNTLDLFEQMELAENLINKNTNIVNQVDCNSISPLMIATVNENFAMVKLLVEKEANVNYQNNGLTALMLATADGYENIAKVLVDKEKSTLESVDSENSTPLFFAAIYNNENMMNFLLDNNANVMHKNIYGDTALMIVVVQGDLKIAQRFIEINKKVVNEVDPEGYSPLILAAGKGNVPMVEMLLKNGANVMHQNKHGKTALMEAKLKNPVNQAAVVKILEDWIR